MCYDNEDIPGLGAAKLARMVRFATRQGEALWRRIYNTRSTRRRDV